MARTTPGLTLLLAVALLSACGGGSKDDGKAAGSGQLTDPAAVPSAAPISGEKTFLIRDNVLSAPGGASTSVAGGSTPVSAGNRGTYEIKSGDFCFTIADQLGVTVEALLASNPGVNCTALMPGTLLRIPPGGTRSTTPTAAATSPGVRATATPPGSGGRTRHEIKPGDLCIDIAAKYNVTVAALQAANNNLNCDNLQVGQVITIP